jgi:hypothetical protein
MNGKLIFWIIVGLLGALLYISPSFFVQRMEGFATAPAATTEPVPAPAADEENIIANLERLLDSPDMLATPTPAPTMIEASGLKAQPQEYETTSVVPAPAKASAADAKASDVLKQGAAFLETKPAISTAPAPVIIQREIVHVPTKCPPPPSCPACPDMRDYIRKDSIPCWACKLG